jgi:hypothetical protein
MTPLLTGVLALVVGPVQFNQPVWLLALIPSVALAVWIARRTLSGMGTNARRVALAIRLVVILLLVGAIAEPQWRKESKAVAVTVLLDASRSAPAQAQAKAEDYLKDAATTAREGDLLGMVTAARDAYVQALPQVLSGKPIDVKYVGATDATNLEAAVRLGMAVMKPDAANRLLLVSDGNETAGSLLSVAQAAKAAGVPIDVIPQRFSIERDVIFDRLVAPANARPNETITLRAVLQSTTKTRGKLTIMLNGQAIPLDPATGARSKVVEIEPGTNVFPLPVAISELGPQRFEALLERVEGPDALPSDTRTENKRALAVTFVGGSGRVLVIASRSDEAEQLMRLLRENDLKAELRTPAGAFTGLDELGGFECVAMVNSSAGEFNFRQQDELKAYVHDLGGGLIMVGGPESFGAGGWIGSPLAEALPIKLDPPQKRQMPRGALVLVMHACEIPEGLYWGRRTAEAAVDALSPQDLCGVLESNWAAGSALWTHPLSVIGDRSQIKRSIRNMSHGDAQSLVEMLDNALASLQKASAGQKHVVIVSDGDPAGPPDSMLQQFIASKITISTVGIGMHRNPTDLAKMRRIAQVTGGNFHEVDPNGKMDSLPQIFIKEAQTVKRSLIWEGEPFSPKISGGFTDTMRGITSLPAVKGYVVAADREGLSQVTIRGQENDPIMAQWQHGLGRVVTFTSDLGNRWAVGWPGWGQYKQLWEQTVRWAMRPTGSPNVRVTTEQVGEQTRVAVSAVDEAGERMNFLRWDARMVKPDLTSAPIELRQSGPGRYEAMVDTAEAGAYTLAMGYEQFKGDGSSVRGSVQAAVTRPFADEFRALRDNAPLLEQVAKQTGGRVLKGDARTDEPWSREGLVLPVALQPIWLLTALGAIGLFLADVAVRRVRIEPAAIARWAAGLFGRAKAGAGGQTESLKAAREKARARMAEAGDKAGGPAPAQANQANKGVKFEATAAELRAARGQSATTPGPTNAAGPGAPIVDRTGQAARDGAGEQGLSRLKQAKKRAQEGMDD